MQASANQSYRALCSAIVGATLMLLPGIASAQPARVAVTLALRALRGITITWAVGKVLDAGLAKATGSCAEDYKAAWSHFKAKEYDQACQCFGKVVTDCDIAEAQDMYGQCHEEGLVHGQKDPVEAEKWYRKAAGHDYSVAQWNLAQLYSTWGDDKAAEAVDLCEKAARHGISNAELVMGDIYYTGDYSAYGRPKDLAKAARWYRAAADDGEANAQFKLAGMYERSEGGLSRDIQAARGLYRKAAQRGLIQAENELGCSYWNNAPADPAQAAFWFEKAARDGNSNGERNLGMAFALGKGKPRDIDEAIKWYDLAAGQGNEDAEKQARALRAEREAQERLVWEPCHHSAHPAGHIVPCQHPAHLWDITPWGAQVPCTHPMHEDDGLVECSHPAHPVGHWVTEGSVP